MRDTNHWILSVTCIATLCALAGCGSIDGQNPSSDPSSCAVFSEAYGSTIEEDTTITADRCLRVEQTVGIRGEISVAVEPGVEMYFAEGTSLYVTGAEFIVAGESDATVTFSGTEETPGWWSGIVMHGTDRAKSNIEHAVIEYAGHEAGVLGTTTLCLHCTHQPSNLQLYGDRGAVQVAIRDTVIRESGAAGVFADEGVEITAFTDNELTANEGPSASIHPRNIGMLDPSSTYGSEIEVYGGTVEDGEEHVWPTLDARYRVSGNILIQGEDTRIDIAAGGTYAFEEQKYFALQRSVLSINGESDDRVTFTGTEELEGWWSGITLHNTDRAANTIAHTTIAYGGNDKSPVGTTTMCLYCENNPANLQLMGHRGPVQVELTGVELKASSGLGLFADSDVTFRGCSGLTFDGNATDWESNDEDGTGNLTGSCSL